MITKANVVPKSTNIDYQAFRMCGINCIFVLSKSQITIINFYIHKFIAMRKIGITLMILLMTMSVSAQRGNGGQRGSEQKSEQRMSPEERQAKELAQLTKVLSLSDKQIVEVANLQTAMSKDIKAKRASMTSNSDRKTMRTEMEALRNKYNEDVLTLLDDEQKEKYIAYLKKKDEKMKPGHSQGQRPEGGQGNRQGGGNR